MPKPSTPPTQKSVLRFVHSGWTKHAAHYEEKTGKVLALGRGIYLPAGESPDHVLRQALDVVAYRYQRPRLFGESARRVREGFSPALLDTVHIAIPGTNGRRERALIAGILQAALHPEVRPESVQSIFVAQRKPIFQMVMPGDAREVILPGRAEILWDTMDDQDAGPEASDALALWQRLSDAERHVLMGHPKSEALIRQWRDSTQSTVLPLSAKQTAEVFLQDIPWGRFYDNGITWNLEVNPGAPDFPAPSDNLRPFLQSLFPETEGDKHQVPGIFLEEPRRLMNLLIRPEGDSTRPIVNSIPDGAELLRHQDDAGLFTGTFTQPDEAMLDAFPDGHPAEPKLSGMQPKAPATINTNGALRMSLHEDPFTVLMKFDYGPLKKQGIPVLEWACQKVARYAGLVTPETALMVDADGSRAALLSERFDVPRGDAPCKGNSRQVPFAMDGAALLGLPTEAKYTANIQRLWQRIQEVSKGKEANLSEMGEQLFDRFALAWAMADGDLHAKNISVLFACDLADANPKRKSASYTPWQMTLSPAYDTVCTRAIPGLGNDRMALKIEGKDDGLFPALWKRFGAILGVHDGDARATRICEKTALGMAAFAQVNPATWGLDGEYAQSVSHMLDRAAAVTRSQAKFMGAHTDARAIPDWKAVLQGGEDVLRRESWTHADQEDRTSKVCRADNDR